MQQQKTAAEGGNKRVATFVQKFYDIVSHPNFSNNNVVGWNATGDAVIVHDSHELERLVLPLFFRHDKYSSFVRQLNQYNFHKTRQSARIEFSNPNFLKDRPDLLVYIERKQPMWTPSQQSISVTPRKRFYFHFLETW